LKGDEQRQPFVEKGSDRSQANGKSHWRTDNEAEKEQAKQDH
jgi:hypothetical protein